MELRDIEIFLILAEELHFGRTAERLRVSVARVSQAIKKQERSIGADLFERTSRAVRLTPVGAQLRDDLRPVYAGLHASMAKARLMAMGKTDVLRIGMLPSNASELRPVWEEFRARHPSCQLSIRYSSFIDPFGPLRRGDIDVLVAWLPVEEHDLTVGPTIFTEPKLLLVGADHELADRKSVSAEVRGNYRGVTAGAQVPDYWEDSFNSFYTPRGRPVEKSFHVTCLEDILLVVGTTSDVVHSITAHTARYFFRPDVVFLGLEEAQMMAWALVWRTENDNEFIRGLARVVRDLGPAEM